MARKSRARSRHKARRGRSRQVAAGLFAAGAVVRSGWGRFAFGILIGLALGIGGVFYLGGLHLGNKGGAKVTTLNASPVQPAQKVAEAPPQPKPAPQVVEPAPLHAKPLGEAAKAAAQTSKPAPAPAAQVATIAPPPINAGADAAWLKNAVAFSVPQGRPLIAVVLDDVGVARSHAELAIDLPGVITLSFMTYADGVADMAARARAKGL